MKGNFRMNLFIDTNIYLSFYHFKSDDLEELKKLAVLIKKKQLILFLPEQVVDEFYRNRENKIADAMKRLREQKIDLQFPQFCKDYPQYETLRDLQKAYFKTHAELVKKVIEDISSRKLRADETISTLFPYAEIIPCDKETIKAARERIDRGNPPGKNGSYGDAINWEALINKSPNKKDIYFITDDKDYWSPLNDNSFNGYLLEEWDKKKKSNLIYYKSLSGFFKEHFPDIKLASEIEKDLLIRDLANTGTFAATHTIIAKLNQYSDFTPAQINAIIDAALSNSQVYWITLDSDVNEFLKKIIKGKETQIDQDKLGELKSALEPEPPYSADIEDELPF
jgi:hypothetical protein